jgi:hypothetical protein
MEGRGGGGGGGEGAEGEGKQESMAWAAGVMQCGEAAV